MRTWLFQGNPDTFDLDGYLADHSTVTWAVRQESLASEMREGDRVYFWRVAGGGKRPSGSWAQDGLPINLRGVPMTRTAWTTGTIPPTHLRTDFG